MITVQDNTKSKYFASFQKMCYQLGHNPTFEAERWEIPEGWIGRGEFDSFEVVKKARPDKILAVRDHKIVYVDLFGNEIKGKKQPKEKEEKVVEVLVKPKEIIQPVSTDWKSNEFKPTEDVPF